MNELMTKDNEWILHFMGSLDRLLDNYEQLTANYRPTLGGERFFTDKEVSARLKVSRRTLQDYRNEGRIAYIQLGGKILYRESDIGNKCLTEWTQLYHRLVPLPKETNNETLPAFSLPITNCLNSILFLLHILNAMATTISRL